MCLFERVCVCVGAPVRACLCVCVRASVGWCVVLAYMNVRVCASEGVCVCVFLCMCVCELE